uniref:CocE/NonD family hydrolase C-terminal non-catalytic domain-containing protein n=1 Tax=Chryseobacterium endophyticum TaxID=1854762 RepID=A0AAU6WPV1_9FLAO
MSEDQRFAEGRPDVLTFTTEALTEDLTLAGEIMAKLNIASSSTDADFAVKLIDIYPEDFKPAEKKDGVIYGNYHQMVRSEIMPARFRNSREKAEALIPNQKTAVNFRLQDVVHTFKKDTRSRSRFLPPGSLCSRSIRRNSWTIRISPRKKITQKLSLRYLMTVRLKWKF